MLVTFRILGSSISIAQPDIPKSVEDARTLIDKYVEFTEEENETSYGLTTIGRRARSITDITVENGSFLHPSLIWEC